jgi:outer membrane lipoprotein SlyB
MMGATPVPDFTRSTHWRTFAATVAGAVAGGFAGNAVEANNNGHAYNAWRFYVQLDDGRNAVVTQYDNPGYRPGDRVAIRDNHLVTLR